MMRYQSVFARRLFDGAKTGQREKFRRDINKIFMFIGQTAKSRVTYFSVAVNSTPHTNSGAVSRWSAVGVALEQLSCPEGKERELCIKAKIDLGKQSLSVPTSTTI